VRLQICVGNQELECSVCLEESKDTNYVSKAFKHIDMYRMCRES
jgi:hypothetical protein